MVTDVNILFIEPRLNFVSMVFGAPKSLLALPNAARIQHLAVLREQHGARKGVDARERRDVLLERARQLGVACHASGGARRRTQVEPRHPVRRCFFDSHLQCVRLAGEFARHADDRSVRGFLLHADPLESTGALPQAEEDVDIGVRWRVSHRPPERRVHIGLEEPGRCGVDDRDRLTRSFRCRGLCRGRRLRDKYGRKAAIKRGRIMLGLRRRKRRSCYV